MPYVNIKITRDGATPEQKAELIKQLQAEGRIVAMAGDGQVTLGILILQDVVAVALLAIVALIFVLVTK